MSYTTNTQTTSAPSRLRIVVGHKRGAGPLVIEQPPMSQADVDCHAKASHVRRPAMTS